VKLDYAPAGFSAPNLKILLTSVDKSAVVSAADAIPMAPYSACIAKLSK
jgi:hypothetical protein